MAIANLANIPDSPETLNEWSFSLQDELRNINARIYETQNIALPEYSLDPLNFQQPYNQLLQLQEMMNNISAVLNTPNYDFVDVDLSDKGERTAWVWLVFTALYDAGNQLQI